MGRRLRAIPAGEDGCRGLARNPSTSGTTGKPKGILDTTGGYLVGTYATAKWIFDRKEEDVFWCTADIGWVTGHFDVVNGPLANGATCLIYEGSLDAPARDRFCDLVRRHGVTIL